MKRFKEFSKDEDIKDFEEDVINEKPQYNRRYETLQNKGKQYLRQVSFKRN